MMYPVGARLLLKSKLIMFDVCAKGGTNYKLAPAGGRNGKSKLAKEVIQHEISNSTINDLNELF